MTTTFKGHNRDCTDSTNFIKKMNHKEGKKTHFHFSSTLLCHKHDKYDVLSTDLWYIINLIRPNTKIIQ